MVRLIVAFLFLGLASMPQCSTDEKAPADCPEPIFNELDYVKKPYKFIRAEKMSKYLVPSEIFHVAPKDGWHVCQSMGLQVATINNVEEYHLVVDIVRKKLMPQKVDSLTRTVLIAAQANIGRNKTLAVYTNPRLQQPIPYHIFNLQAGKYFQKDMDCLGIECGKDMTRCRMEPQYCRKGYNRSSLGVIPFCQYPDNGACYAEGSQVVDFQGADIFWNIGHSDKWVYLGSKIQKTWQEAKDICEEGKMKLLSLIKSDPEETDTFMKFITKYAISRKSPLWATATWTSGLVQNEWGPGEWFQFVSTGEQWSYEDNGEHFRWVPKPLVSKPKEEHCIGIVSSQPKVLRPISCHLPMYFVCQARVEEEMPHNHSDNSMESGSGHRTKQFCVTYAPDPPKCPGLPPYPDPIENEPLPSPPAPPPKRIEETCKKAGGDSCQCRKHTFCRFEGLGLGCVPEQKFCGDGMKQVAYECVRHNGQYLVGGQVCLAAKTNGNKFCKHRRIVMAVNLGYDAQDHIDVNGIEYKAMAKVRFDDPYGIGKKLDVSKANGNIRGVPTQDEPLYKTFQTTDASKMKSPNSDMCIAYQIPATQSGDYELTIKAIEVWNNRRTFNIKFNQMRILREVNITDHTGTIGAAIDLLLNYRISEDLKTLTMRGHPDSKIRGDEIQLEFCLGECRDGSSIINPVISAFAVLQFTRTGDDIEEELELSEVEDITEAAPRSEQEDTEDSPASRPEDAPGPEDAPDENEGPEYPSEPQSELKAPMRENGHGDGNMKESAANIPSAANTANK